MIDNFKIFESKREVSYTCNQYGIENYNIHDDMSVSVRGNVFILWKDLRYIPIKFKEVSGNFNCNDNVLISLIGCPEVVGGGFYCVRNNLESLEGCPKIIGTNFNGFPELSDVYILLVILWMRFMDYSITTSVFITSKSLMLYKVIK